MAGPTRRKVEFGKFYREIGTTNKYCLVSATPDGGEYILVDPCDPATKWRVTYEAFWEFYERCPKEQK